MPDGTECGLVDQVCKVCANGTGRGLGDLVEVHILSQLDVAGMDPQRLITAGKIGPVDNDAAVKPAGTQQRLVQNLRPVGSRQNDNALAGVEAVDFG